MKLCLWLVTAIVQLIGEDGERQASTFNYSLDSID